MVAPQRGHDPEKWQQVRGKDHAQTINSSELPIQHKAISPSGVVMPRGGVKHRSPPVPTATRSRIVGRLVVAGRPCPTPDASACRPTLGLPGRPRVFPAPIALETMLDASAGSCRAERRRANRGGLARAKSYRPTMPGHSHEPAVGRAHASVQYWADVEERVLDFKAPRAPKQHSDKRPKRPEIASSAPDDELIPPHRAKPRGWNFQERQRRRRSSDSASVGAGRKLPIRPRRGGRPHASRRKPNAPGCLPQS